MILITGATGQVGTALVAELQAQKLPFRALAHTRASYERLAAQHVEAVLVDQTNPAELAATFEDVERFFLLTPTNPEQIVTERRLVDAALQAGVRHIVYLSVINVDDPDVPLFRPHFEMEQYIKQSGIGYTFLRPNGFMQNLGTMGAAQIKQQNLIANSVGHGTVSFVDVRDIAAVAVAALSDDQDIGETYEITGSEAVSYGQIAEKLTALLGREVRYLPLSDDEQRNGLLSAGVPALVADGLTALYRSYREGKAAVVANTVERITRRPARRYDAYFAEHRSLFE